MTRDAKGAAATRRTELNQLPIPAGFDIRRTRRPRPPTRQRPSMDAETVIARLEEAGHTLLSLPQTGRTRHRSIAEALGAFTGVEIGRPEPPAPPASRMIRMDQALAWITLIPADRLVLRRIVGCRCLVSPLTERHLFSWRRLARLLGADHKMIRRWHEAGIDIITAELAREAALMQSWDRLR